MRVDELERELRAERPEPDPDFARRLDEWAAAGFPRDRGLGPRPPAPARRGVAARALWERITSVPPRRVLLPRSGAVATVLVVIGVAISQNGDPTGSTGARATALGDRRARGPGEPAAGQEARPATRAG